MRLRWRGSEGSELADGRPNFRDKQRTNRFRRANWIIGIVTLLVVVVGVCSWWWTLVVRLPRTVLIHHWTVEIAGEGQVVVLNRPFAEANAADRWYLASHRAHVYRIGLLASYPTFDPSRPGFGTAPTAPSGPPPQLKQVDCGTQALVYVCASGGGQSLLLPFWPLAAIGITVLTAAWVIAVHRRMRQRVGVCGGCGYSLAGLSTGTVYPECGHPA